jgi:hypothetical protein
LVTWIKQLLPTYLNFKAEISGLPTVRNSTVSVYPIEFSGFACGILFAEKIGKFFCINRLKTNNLLAQ